MELSENTGINVHVIELIVGKQPPYRSIYILSLVELEPLKTYIETYYKTGFFQPSKSPARVLILFDKKLDGSFYLYVDYRDLNKLTIKNWYTFLFIDEALNRLGRAKGFI